MLATSIRSEYNKSLNDRCRWNDIHDLGLLDELALYEGGVKQIARGLYGRCPSWIRPKWT